MSGMASSLKGVDLSAVRKLMAGLPGTPKANPPEKKNRRTYYAYWLGQPGGAVEITQRKRSGVQPITRLRGFDTEDARRLYAATL